MNPRVIIHSAVSLDGCTTGFEPNAALYYHLAGTWNEDAILAGADTLLAAAGADDPANQTAVEESESGIAARPLLVVPDSRGRIRNWPYWQRQPFWSRVIVLVSRKTPGAYLESLLEEDIAYIQSGPDHVDLPTALRSLSLHYGARTIRVDSGGLLNTVLLRDGLVDEISLLIHPVIVGNRRAGRFVLDREEGFAGIGSLELLAGERLQNGIYWLRYTLSRAS